MVKIARTGQQAAERQAAQANRRTQDICGLILFFMGAASLLCLAWPQHAPIPVLVDDGLRWLAGVGAYAIPLLLMFVGSMFLIGYERLSFSQSSRGTILLFLDFITWRHVHLMQRVDALNPLPEVRSGLIQAQVPGAGGWVGWLFGTVFYGLLGGAVSYLLLVLVLLIAAILIVDQPFIEILRRIRMRGQAGAQAAGQGLQRGLKNIEEEKRLRGLEESSPAVKAVVSSRPAAIPAAKSGAKFASEFASSDEAAQDRALRAARVAERALVPAAHAGSGTIAAQDDPAHPATLSKSPNLFNLTRLWRGEAQEEHTVEETRRQGEEETAVQNVTKPVTKSQPKREKASAAAADVNNPNTKPSDIGTGGGEETLSSSPLSPLSSSEFVLPPLTLLAEAPPAATKRAQNELTDNVSTIERTLEQFNIGANVVEVASGPSVTRYEIQLAPGIKVSKIVSLADNLAMSLAAIDVRVEAPIPGKSAIGVEVPNGSPVMVTLRECLETDEFKNAASKLTVALGKDVSGQYKYADLTKMPHLLIGGSTNSGKSVCLNVLIASLVYRNTPRDVRMLMIDPKRVELSLWDGIPHLMHPVVKDVKQAAGIFRAALREMDRRYDLFATLGTRNLEGFNARVPDSERLPYLVLIVDELADLMMQQGPEVETSICRLAQLARATGIHLIIATQRPSVDIITGTIKANISSRIAFAVASQVDSRTILDMTGADRLIGKGDMLFMPIDASKPLRIQGCYLSENETNAIVDHLKEQEKPVFTFAVADGSPSGSSSYPSPGGGGGAEDEGENDDQFFEQAVRLVVNNGQASTSMLQRRFRIGYTRAARIVEMMEEKGIVGPLNGAKPRELLVSKDDVERLFNPGAALPSVEAYQDDGE